MGFFTALGRMIQGKPVFVVDEDQQKQSAQSATEAGGYAQPRRSDGQKIYPQVYVNRVDHQEPGANTEWDFFIKNASSAEAEVDRIELLGGHGHEINTHLRAGEVREFRVYSGPRPTSQAVTSCKIFYKDPSGDYFCSEHYIEFKQMADKTYTINRVRFLHVRDV